MHQTSKPGQTSSKDCRRRGCVARRRAASPDRAGCGVIEAIDQHRCSEKPGWVCTRSSKWARAAGGECGEARARIPARRGPRGDRHTRRRPTNARRPRLRARPQQVRRWRRRDARGPPARAPSMSARARRTSPTMATRLPSGIGGRRALTMQDVCQNAVRSSTPAAVVVRRDGRQLAAPRLAQLLPPPPGPKGASLRTPPAPLETPSPPPACASSAVAAASVAATGAVAAAGVAARLAPLRRAAPARTAPPARAPTWGGRPPPPAPAPPSPPRADARRAPRSARRAPPRRRRHQSCRAAQHLVSVAAWRRRHLGRRRRMFASLVVAAAAIAAARESSSYGAAMAASLRRSSPPHAGAPPPTRSRHPRHHRARLRRRHRRLPRRRRCGPVRKRDSSLDSALAWEAARAALSLGARSRARARALSAKPRSDGQHRRHHELGWSRVPPPARARGSRRRRLRRRRSRLRPSRGAAARVCCARASRAFVAFSGLSILPRDVTVSDFAVRATRALSYLRCRSRSPCGCRDAAARRARAPAHVRARASRSCSARSPTLSTRAVRARRVVARRGARDGRHPSKSYSWRPPSARRRCRRRPRAKAAQDRRRSEREPLSRRSTSRTAGGRRRAGSDRRAPIARLLARFEGRGPASPVPAQRHELGQEVRQIVELAPRPLARRRPSTPRRSTSRRARVTLGRRRRTSRAASSSTTSRRSRSVTPPVRCSCVQISEYFAATGTPPIMRLGARSRPPNTSRRARKEIYFIGRE